jgi:tetratricopeptide (TPR) repeat protein
MKASIYNRIRWVVWALMAGVVLGVGLLGVRLRPYWVARCHGEFATLPGAVLHHAPLANANLQGANLWGADLRGADLRGAYLAYATLDRAHLDGANLRRATICCSLRGASLRGADLTGADLTWALLDGADLTHARLTGARYDDHTFWPGGFDPEQHGAMFQVEDVQTESEGGEGKHENAERALRWAERKLKRVFQLPTRQASALSPKEAAEAFEAVLEKYGDLPRAYIGLAKCDLRSGDVTGAMRSLGQAIRLLRSDVSSRRECLEARRLLWVLRAASIQVPGGHRPLQIQRFNAPVGIPLWAVLSATVETGDPSGMKFVKPRLTLFRLRQGHYRKIWQSDVLRDPRLKAGAFDAVALYVADLTGDGVPEAIVEEVFLGGSWAPSHLDVFAWRRQRLVKILGVSSSQPVWIEDLDHDGRYEIGNYYNIGWDMSHAEQPYWTDIYAYERGHYVLANAAFPREFRGWLRRLRSVLKWHPGDFEILKYKGIAHDIEGRPTVAFAALRSAARECAALLETESDPRLHSRLEWQLNDIRRRIIKLKR